MNNPETLTGAQIDTLWTLFFNGPTQDGDVPSKQGRDDLCDANLAFRYEGWQSLTKEGVAKAIELGLDRKKERIEQNRGRR